MSQTYASFNLIVHYPSLKENQKELNTRVAQVHADKVNNVFHALNWSSEEKVKLIDRILEAIKKNI